MYTTVTYNLIYAVGSEGFYIIDVSEPASPELLNYTSEYGPFIGVDSKENYAYVTQSSNRVNIFDIRIVKIWVYRKFNTDDYANSVYVFCDYAYVAVDDNGLIILNVSNPSNPILVGQYSTFDSCTYDMELMEHFLILLMVLRNLKYLILVIQKVQAFTTNSN